MDTKNFYKALMDALGRGQRAVVMTRLAAQAGEPFPERPDVGWSCRRHACPIEKALLTEGSDAWRAFEETCAQGGAGFRQDGPVCTQVDGAGMTVYELYAPKPRMVILGGGHIALALVKMAKLTEFDVVVFDDRPMYANPKRFPEADEVICDDFARVFERVRVRATDYVVIVTRGHRHDTECLEGVLDGTAPAYTGMIGSRRRVAIVLKELEARGYAREALEAVRTPIGLRIGAVTPAEISVSILAEVIETKRKGAGAQTGQTCNTEIAEWLAQHGDEADALITILATQGSVPRETGAKMAINYQGSTAGTIGGGCAEGDVMHRARTVIREGGFEIVSVDTTDTAEEDGMACGGTLQVLIEPAHKP
ncbi:MAG: XdhC family protein [Clostridiales Family XIII bacterium]|jgi:xanthine dehydrogenase accessory factor|nr:XdhC family protein [Clostridiales Family XIII bacterium]